jgi:ankyrin repeat protein
MNEISINAQRSSGNTPLSAAVECNHTAVIELLLATGKVDINTMDDLYLSNTWWNAIENGHRDVVNLLLTADQLNMTDALDCSSLSTDVKNGHPGIVKLLLATDRFGMNMRSRYVMKVLLWAAQHSHLDVVKLFCAAPQVNIDEKD